MDTCNFPGFLSAKGNILAKSQLIVLLCNLECRNAWQKKLDGQMRPHERAFAIKASAEAHSYILDQSEALLSYV